MLANGDAVAEAEDAAPEDERRGDKVEQEILEDDGERRGDQSENGKDRLESLDPDAREEDLHHILRPFPAAEMVAYPVSARVNSTAVDDPECERRVAEAPPAPAQTTLF